MLGFVFTNSISGASPSSRRSLLLIAPLKKWNKEARNPGTKTGRGRTVELEHQDLTGRIIGAAIEVHRALGPGFLESIHENALAIELRQRDIPFERQLSVPVL